MENEREDRVINDGLSYLCLVISICMVVLNYGHYTTEITTLEKIVTFYGHLRGFGEQYYTNYIVGFNWDSYKYMADALNALVFVFRTYFINWVAILFFYLAIFFRTEGSFFRRIRVPFSFTIFFVCLYILLIILSKFN